MSKNDTVVNKTASVDVVKDMPEAVARTSVGAPSESAVKVLSSADSLVADLAKEQPSFEQVAAMKVSEARILNPLELPEECASLEKKQFRFGWLNKDKELDVKLRTTGWVLCTRTSAPFLKPSRFGSHGAVERGGMLLAFMPEEMYRKVFEERPAELSRAKVKYYTDDITRKYDKDAPVQLYKPKDVEEDR